MKKNIVFFLIILALALALAAILIILRGDEDTWLCQDGQWIKHGNPSAPQPTEICKSKTASIYVTKPQSNEIVSSPLEIEGEARGNWFFEGQFPIQLIGETDHDLIAQGIARAQGEWTTNDFVPFKATLEFAQPKATIGTLILEKDNPSGLPANAGHIKIPVRFRAAETIKVKVYFNNNKLDPEFSCNKVFPVEREIVKTEAVARASLEELLKGPTNEDRTLGYFTSINQGVKIQSLTIKDATALVDFDGQLEYQVGGSCRVAAIRLQITQTLKQFPTVKNVMISIDGRTEDILQP